LIRTLRDAVNMTVIVVTHALESAFSIPDRISVLDRGHIFAVGTGQEIRGSDNPHIQVLLNHQPETAVPDAQEYLRRLPGVLFVGALDGDGMVRGRPLLYTNTAEGKAVRQHNYYHWLASPARLVQGQLVTFLNDSNAARCLVTPYMRVRADFEQIGRIQRLERVFDTTGTGMVAALVFAVVWQTDREFLLVDSYRAEVRADDDLVRSSVQAMNAVLEQIFTTFAMDLGRRTTVL